MAKYELRPDRILLLNGAEIAENVASFAEDGAGGLYILDDANEVARYDGTPHAWTTVSGTDVQKMAVAGGTLYILNDARTVARYDGTPHAWTTVSGADVQKMAVAGGTLYILNDKREVAQYGGTPPVWTPVSGADVQKMAVAGGTLYILNDEREVAQYGGTPPVWTPVSGKDVQKMAVAGGGLYILNDEREVAQYGGTPPVWTPISGKDVQKMAVAGGTLFILNDAMEVARYDGTPHAWTVVSGSSGTDFQGEKPTTMFGMKVDGWYKFRDPVLPIRAGKWDSVATREISLIVSDLGGKTVNTDDGSILAFYGGYDGSGWNVGSAVSRDDGFTWGNRSDGPVIPLDPASWFAAGLFQPSVIRISATGERMMMTQGWKTPLNAPHNGSLGVFLWSPRTKKWTDQGQKLTTNQFKYESGHPGTIEEMGVPSVIKRQSGDFLVLFEAEEFAKPNVSGGAWRIFGATSPDFIGNWTPLNGGAPLFLPDPSHAWEDVGVANPKIMEIRSNKYVMAYNGHGQGWQVGFAFTTDLVTWTRSPDPVLRPSGRANLFDQMMTETSFCIKREADRLNRFYFQGYDKNENPQVGVAVNFPTV